MFIKIVFFIHLFVHSMSLFVQVDDTIVSHRISATAKMISKLIEESRRSTVLVTDLKSEILENFVRSNNDLRFTVMVNNLRDSVYFKMRKVGATVLHLRNFEEFERFYKLIRSDVFLYDGHFILIYDRTNTQEIEKIFSKFWKLYIFNVNVLVNVNGFSSDLVSIFTYMPFSNGSCGNIQPVYINGFDKISMKWSTNVFFPEKFQQLNRCPIRFGFYENNPGIVIDRNASGTTRISGINADIGVMFSKKLNFTLSMHEYEQDMGVIFKNKTATAMLKRAMENEVDLIFATSQMDRFEALSGTRTVYTDKMILVVPPPFTMDPMKKILLPFTFVSWISIGLVALLACCIVKMMDFTPQVVHDYVIGRNVRGSVLNVCNVFLGGSQQILPRSNFPRFLLAKFLLFTMIIRSLYQGEVFGILKRDVETVKLDSFDEFIKNEYTFYIFQSLAARLVGTGFMLRFVKEQNRNFILIESKFEKLFFVHRHQVISNSDRSLYNLKTLDPSFRGVVFGYFSPVMYENLIQRKNYMFRICKEVLTTNSFVFYFTKNFYLLNEFNELIQIFESAGLIDHITVKYVDMDLLKTNQKHPPSALKYRNIEGFFTLFYFGCVAALVSFVTEIVCGFVRGRKHIRKEQLTKH